MRWYTLVILAFEWLRKRESRVQGQGASEMAQWVPAVKPENLSSIPQIHMVEEVNEVLKMIL